MRKIKFRAWDKNTKHMISEFALVPRYVGFNGSIISVGEGLEAFGCQPRVGREDVELMQFTGLLDKNGKEIYESDLLQSPRTKLYYEVVWDDESASWYALCANPDKDFQLGSYGWSDAEVIGNIYENPELLNNKQINKE